MTGVHQDKGRAIGFVASLAVHLSFAIALWSGVLTSPVEPREARNAAEGIAAAPSHTPDAAPARAPSRAARGTLVPQSPESPSRPAASAGGRGSGALEYASIPREGYVDGPRPGRTRWEILQPIVHVAKTMESQRFALLDHLWQSTAFAMAAAMLTLAFRRHRAAARYSLWFAASVKFLVPFSILTALGSRLPGAPAAQVMAERALATVRTARAAAALAVQCLAGRSGSSDRRRGLVRPRPACRVGVRVRVHRRRAGAHVATHSTSVAGQHAAAIGGRCRSGGH